MKLRLIYDTVHNLVKPYPFPLEKPIVLQLPVIDICNSQCQMCRIWENKKSNDITPEQLRLGLRNPLFSEVTSVGLNGGEPTLRKDLGQLAAVLFEELPKLHSISLITNAYKYEEVIARVKDVGAVVKEHGGFLDLMISLDGFGEMHDKVRGKPGNFDRAQHVLKFAQESELVDNVRIGCTIIKENVYGLSDLFEFCQSKGLYIKYRLGIPHQRLYTQNLLDPYTLTETEKYHVVEFLEGLIAHYETNENQKFFYRSLIDQIVHKAPRKAGCDWKHRGATITSKGDLLYCAVQSKVLGNITDSNSEQLYFDNQDHLKEIIRNHCDNCNHDYVGIPSRSEQIRQLFMRVVKKLPAKELLKISYRRLLIRDFRHRSLFASNFNKLLTMGQAPIAWPGGGNGKRILICGWYGTETLGDKGILGGILQALREHLGIIDAALVSLFPYVSEMTRRQMDELKGVHIVNRQHGVQLAALADLVVFGGGPLMAIDETADMLAIFKTAKNANRKTLIAGCGVGPLGASWHNKAIGEILRCADARIFRDEKSRETASDLGVNVHTDIVAEDPAFTWLQSQRQALMTTNPATTEKILLLGLRDFPYKAYARHLSEKECLVAKQRYEKAVLDALDMLVDQFPDLLIRPLPMCTNHFGDDDRWFYRRLFRGNEKLSKRLDLSLLGSELTPNDYCKAFHQSTAALTMRFHSVVFALGLGVPTVTIDYTLGQGKVHSLAERFELPHQSLKDLDANFITDKVARLLKGTPTQAPLHKPSFTQALCAALTKLNITKSETQLNT